MTIRRPRPLTGSFAPGEAPALDWQVEAVERLSAERTSEISALWRSDPDRSPFAGAAFLGVLVEAAHGAGSKAILARGLSADGTLAALWPLELSASGTLRLLQHRHGDHATCLARPEIPARELGEGLARALPETGATSLELTRIPPWGRTLAGAQEALALCAWPHRAFPATPCPVLAVEGGPGAGARLAREVESHRRVRTYTNRLAREPGYAFDVCEDDTGLESWADAFCDAHERRWDATATPSEFRDRGRRAHLLACLRAWQRDGTLVRFAVLREGRPISLTAAVRSGDRLVYHLVTTDPAGEVFRAGHVLIRLIGLWMGERDLAVLDFGEGEEGYKLRYANGDERLWRLHAARRVASARYLGGRLEEWIRSSPAAQARWDRLVNQGVRADAMNGVRNLRLRLRGLWRVYGRASWSTRTRMLGAKLGARREIVYRALGRAGPRDAEIVELKPFEALALLEEEQGLLPADRCPRLEGAEHGARAFGTMQDGRAIHVSWLAPVGDTALPEPAGEAQRPAWLIRDVVTAFEARGLGLCSRTLATLLGTVPAGQPVWIYTDAWNGPARRAIEKGGFAPVAVRVTPRGGGPARFEPLAGPRDGA